MSSDSTTPDAKPPRRGLLRRRPRDPDKKPGRLAQVKSVYRMTRKADPVVTWWMLLAFAGVLLIALTIGLFTGHPIYASVLGLPMALLAAMFILARRAEAAAFKQIEGQPGAAGAALRVLRRRWTVEEAPVAVDARTQDSVFRVVGRPGVILVSDGPPHRVGRMLEAERRKVARVLPSVPVHLIQAGDGEGQVPLRKVGRAVNKLKPKITKAEASQVVMRLKSLGGMRPPIPQGIDPFRARPNRKMMRGR